MLTKLVRLVTSLGIAGALAVAASAQVSLTAALSGAFETPPNGSSATGSATANYDPATGVLSCTVTVTGMTGSAAHIHTGAAGVAGGILIPLSGGPTTYSGSGTLAPASVTAMLHAGLYVNVHSSTFPGGQIRGQLLISENLVSALSGAKETPPNGSSAVGEAATMIDQLTGALHCKVIVSGMTPTAAHIHRGAAGVAGPIVFPLPSIAPGMFELGGVVLTDADMLDMLSGKMYVNVHSAAFPGGEIRDQIVAGGFNQNGNSISVTTGGVVEMAVDFGSGSAGDLYLVLGSLSGTSPGFPVDGSLFPLPLNVDSYFLYTLTNHVAPLSASFGVLNGAGKATAKFTLAPLSDPSLVGISADHAGVSVAPAIFVPKKVTCPKAIKIILT